MSICMRWFHQIGAIEDILVYITEYRAAGFPGTLCDLFDDETSTHNFFS